MQNVIERIAQTSGVPLRYLGALRLVRRQDCEQLVNACRSGSVRIVGIEAFKVVGDTVTPDMDMIADFSSLSLTTGEDPSLLSALEAADFFRGLEVPADTLFHFTVQEQPSSRRGHG
jgi:hypothetical protein